MADIVNPPFKGTQGKRPSIQQEASVLHQHFGLFNIRCAFLLESLANFSFDEKVETVSSSSLGAICYIGELLEELTELQEKFDELNQRMRDSSE